MRDLTNLHIDAYIQIYYTNIIMRYEDYFLAIEEEEEDKINNIREQNRLEDEDYMLYEEFRDGMDEIMLYEWGLENYVEDDTNIKLPPSIFQKRML